MVVVVGVEGENRNKLGACQLTGIRPGSDRDGPGYVVLALPISWTIPWINLKNKKLTLKMLPTYPESNGANISGTSGIEKIIL